jgi:HEXXH motif-containing protein
MGTLVGAIKASLVDVHRVPWLPTLTPTLVEKGWKTLSCRTGIGILDYGTARVLVAERNAPRHVVACLPIYPHRDDAVPPMLTEVLSREAMQRYQNMGLAFYTPDEIVHTGVIDCVQDAIHLLGYVPTLQTTVAALVRSCHLLKAPDDDFDVSHSDPQAPFSIFVSVPQRRRPQAALRVVEAIVHEAMHLQLTLIEQILPLVYPSDHTYFSPWKGNYRSPQGVLHALYVFRVVDRFLAQLQAWPVWSAADAGYMRGRRDDIARQMGAIETFKDCPALTTWGTEVVRRLMAACKDDAFHAARNA